MSIKFTNFAYSTLAVGISSGATTLSVAGGHGARFPTLGAGDYFYATLENAAAVREIVKVTARTVDAFTIVRAQDNTTAMAWLAGDSVALRLNAAAMTDFVPVTAGAVQAQTYTAFTTAGTSTAYTLTPSPAISAYTAGPAFWVTFHVASGASPTLAISGLTTPPNLVRQLNDGTYANIAADDIPINHRSKVILLSATQALVQTLPLVKDEPVNTQTGTTYTFLTSDKGKLVTCSNAASIAGTLPQAGAAFPAGWWVDVQNRGVGTLTITPTTSTLDGVASLAITTGQGVRLISDGANYFTARGMNSTAMRLGTVAVTTSGTSIDFTGIPTWVKKISVSLSGVSVSGTSIIQLLLGTSSGVEASGYVGTVGIIQDAGASIAANLASGFSITPSGSATQSYYGTISLVLLNATTNLWSCSATLGRSDALGMHFVAGTKALVAVLDRVRLTTAGGANTFDAGSMNILYEG